MTFPRLNFKQIEKFAIDNSPIILTVIGVVGTVGTAVLTHRAALRADAIYSGEMDRRLGEADPEPWSRKKHIQLVGKCYIPPVTSGVVTVGCIVMANRIGSKRAAAVAAAYTISEKAYSEYREKVVEKFGEQKERNMREELSQDQINRNPMSESNVIVVGDGDTICCDLFSMRYFRSSAEKIKAARNEVNYLILHNGYASLTDFYNELQIPRTDVSDEIGWTQDKLLELDMSAVVNEEGQPCLAFRFQTHPIRGYHHLHP